MSRAGVLAVCLLLLGCGPSQSGRRGSGTGGGGASQCAPGADHDGDLIADADEGGLDEPPRDTDGDGTPDFEDADSDGDGIPDAVERGGGAPCQPPVDSDGDGKPDFVDLDSDDPGNADVPDAEEAGADPTQPVDTDQDGQPDYRDPDDDGDGIPDRVELTPPASPVPAAKLADAPDADGDGTPDFRDADADGDTVADAAEGAVDTDGDLVPNFRDLDSDGDCLPDAIEAGDADPATTPVDTDHDGTPDFLDADADGDGLTDGQEDADCNGMRDACETDRALADTDGDGVSDLIEFEDCAVKPKAQQPSCRCDGSDPASSPLTHGDFVFVEPYQQPPSPLSETLDLGTDVSQADVVFSIDTTGSMSGAIHNLQQSLADIAGQVQKKIANLAMGVVEFTDFDSKDAFVVRYDYRLTTVSTAAGLQGVQTALNGLKTGDGVDYPEAGWEALYSIAGGPPLSVNANGGAWTSTFNLGATTPTVPPAGETQGTLGGAGFRAGSVPIIVTVSDAEWHDAPGSAKAGDPESGLDAYGSAFAGVPSRRTAITQAQALDAHVMGLAGTGGGASGQPKLRMTATAKETGAVVTPADFGPVGVRPAGCAVGECCTGLDGAGEAAQGGTCPLAFTYDDGTGKGVSSGVVSGIVALANGLKFDIHVEAGDVDPMTVDRFVDKLVPNVSGAGPAAMCVVVPAATLQDNFAGPKAGPGHDGVPDTFPGIGGGVRVCFDVIPKTNTSVMETAAPQFFHARLQVKGVAGGNTVNLGTPRDVFFLVPPSIENGPIP